VTAVDTDLESGALPQTGRHRSRSYFKRIPLWMRAIQVVVALLFAFTVWRYAWVSDDALITVRSALNTANGMGPVYNPGERVQAFTHPTWFGLMLLTGVVTQSWIYAPLFLSIVLATLAAAWLLWNTTQPSRLAFVSAGLLLSNSLVEWSTSGLEGALAMVLTAAVFFSTTRSMKIISAIAVGVLAALLVLTRLDYVLLVAPMAVGIVWQQWGRWRCLAKFGAAFFVPLILWFGFALAYYGFALPSTFAAKTNTTIPRSDLIASGLNYLYVSFRFDPVILVIAVLVIVIVATAGSLRSRLWLCGAIVYVVYVIWIGGDFMAGRFLALPLFVLLLTIGGDSSSPRKPLSDRLDTGERRWQTYLVFVGAVVLAATCALHSDLLQSSLNAKELPPSRWGATSTEPPSSRMGVIDERAFYAAFGGALDPLVSRTPLKNFYPATLGEVDAEANAWSFSSPEPLQKSVVGCGGLGSTGLYYGSRTHIIDQCGLTDRFIAGLLFDPQGQPWRPGHFMRWMPEGYQDAIEHRDPSLLKSPHQREELRALWNRIR